MFANAGSRGGRSRTQRSVSDPFHWDSAGNTLDINGGWTSIIPLSSTGGTYVVSVGSSVTGTGNFASSARLIFGSDFSLAWSPAFVGVELANAAGTATTNLQAGGIGCSGLTASTFVDSPEVELGYAGWRGSNQAISLNSSNSGICWTPTSFAATPDTGLIRSSTRVVGFSDGLGVNTNGWMNWAGERRVTTNFTSSSATLTAITGISSVALQAGRNYAFKAWLAVTGSSLGGVQIGITCSSTTITTLLSDGYMHDAGVMRGSSVGVITSTGTPVCAVSSATVTSSNPAIRVDGMIRVASSGLFGLTLAQSTASATQTIVSSGSYMIVYDMP